MDLKRAALRVAESSGLLHSLYLGQLREYLNTTQEEKLVREVQDIVEPNQLRALWEAGLNSRMQAAVMERLEKLS